LHDGAESVAVGHAVKELGGPGVRRGSPGDQRSSRAQVHEPVDMSLTNGRPTGDVVLGTGNPHVHDRHRRSSTLPSGAILIAGEENIPIQAMIPPERCQRGPGLEAAVRTATKRPTTTSKEYGSPGLPGPLRLCGALRGRARGAARAAPGGGARLDGR